MLTSDLAMLAWGYNVIRVNNYDIGLEMDLFSILVDGFVVS